VTRTIAKRCPLCGEAKDVSEYNKDRPRRDGLQTWCRDCQRKRRAEDEQRNPTAQRRRGKPRTIKTVAGERVRLAVRRGKLIKPTSCDECGTPGKGIGLQAHHADYTKPLDVAWLCPTCHAGRHQ
jgi:hypothetical protein